MMWFGKVAIRISNINVSNYIYSKNYLVFPNENFNLNNMIFLANSINLQSSVYKSITK